jgi:hypothetical protein
MQKGGIWPRGHTGNRRARAWRAHCKDEERPRGPTRRRPARACAARLSREDRLGRGPNSGPRAASAHTEEPAFPVVQTARGKEEAGAIEWQGLPQSGHFPLDPAAGAQERFLALPDRLHVDAMAPGECAHRVRCGFEFATYRGPIASAGPPRIIRHLLTPALTGRRFRHRFQ